MGEHIRLEKLGKNTFTMWQHRVKEVLKTFLFVAQYYWQTSELAFLFPSSLVPNISFGMIEWEDILLDSLTYQQSQNLPFCLFSPVSDPHYWSLFHSSPPFKIIECILIIYKKIFLWSASFDFPCLLVISQVYATPQKIPFPIQQYWTTCKPPLPSTS